MPLWGANNSANKAPKFKVIERKGANAVNSRGNNTAFNNTTIGAWGGSLMSKGIFGANTTDVATRNQAGGKRNIDSTGWHEVRIYTGPVKSMTITAGGSGYTNNTVGTVTSPYAGGNTSFTVTTNATGGVVAAVITVPGKGYTNTNTSGLTVTLSGGTGATFVPVLGGRAGRVHYECLVAGGMKGASPTTLP